MQNKKFTFMDGRLVFFAEKAESDKELMNTALDKRKPKEKTHLKGIDDFETTLKANAEEKSAELEEYANAVWTRAIPLVTGKRKFKKDIKEMYKNDSFSLTDSALVETEYSKAAVGVWKFKKSAEKLHEVSSSLMYTEEVIASLKARIEEAKEIRAEYDAAAKAIGGELRWHPIKRLKQAASLPRTDTLERAVKVAEEARADYTSDKDKIEGKADKKYGNVRQVETSFRNIVGKYDANLLPELDAALKKGDEDAIKKLIKKLEEGTPLGKKDAHSYGLAKGDIKALKSYVEYLTSNKAMEGRAFSDASNVRKYVTKYTSDGLGKKEKAKSMDFVMGKLKGLNVGNTISIKLKGVGDFFKIEQELFLSRKSGDKLVFISKDSKHVLLIDTNGKYLKAKPDNIDGFPFLTKRGKKYIDTITVNSTGGRLVDNKPKK